MYIEKVPNRNSPPAVLLRRSYRSGGKVIKETLANLTKWPTHLVEGLRALIRKERNLPAEKVCDSSSFEITRSYPHGHVKAALGTLYNIGLDKIVSSRKSNIVLLVIGMIVSRVINCCSKLATARDLNSSTCTSSLSLELKLGDKVTVDDLYEAVDWLGERQEKIQNKLIKKHLDSETLVLWYDVSSSYFEGDSCPLAEYGHSRDSRSDKKQIVYGLICNKQGCPVSIEVFKGNTADPNVFTQLVAEIKKKYSNKKFIFIGDRGLITSARIKEDLKTNDKFYWISALRSEQIRSLFDEGIINLADFTSTNMKEVTSKLYPTERLVVCKNEDLSKERAARRENLLVATEADLLKIARRKISGKEKIGLAVGKIINKHKMAKHFVLTIADTSFTYLRNQASIEAEKQLDGFYVIRSSIESSVMDSCELVSSYKNLSKVEFAFRTLKSDDIQIRPIFHYKESRVRAHVFLCMLAYYLEWHMRQKLAPMLFEDHDKLGAANKRTSIVDPAKCSDSATKKAASKSSSDDKLPVHSFNSLLRDLSTLTLNQIKFDLAGALPFFKTTSATKLQQKAFSLLEIH